MKIGLKGNAMVLTATKNPSADGTKMYYSVAIVGADGFSDNLNCDEEVYNHVMDEKFVKPCMYSIDFAFSSGTSSKGRYSYLRVANIGQKVG